MSRSRSIVDFANLARPVGFALLLVMVAGSTGCSISPKPRDHWWQFWRTKKADAAKVYYPDVEVLPPAPDSPGAPGSGEVLPIDDTLPPPPGVEVMSSDMEEPDPLRMEATNTVSELQTVHFGYDSSQLSPEAIAILDANAQWLTANPSYQIQIEGHCDERGTLEYNLNLGDRRAKSVKAYLVSRGIDPNRLHTISYGEERPLDTTGTDAAWSMNRRVQFLVY